MNAIRTLLEFNINLFETDRPKVLVVSHERSGTHFMMNSLAANFGYVANPFMNLDSSLGVNFYSSVAFRDILANFQNHAVANIFKSHHDLEFYREFFAQNPMGFKIIYILRDVYEVMVSYHRHLLTLPWNEGAQSPNVSEFLRTAPSGAMTRYQYRHCSSMVDRWVMHVQSALAMQSVLSADNFFIVDYSQLNCEFEATLKRISAYLKVPCRDPSVRPTRHENVVPPILGLADQEILDYYTAEDIDFVELVARPTLEALRTIRTSDISAT
jgi:hypothetical protein